VGPIITAKGEKVMEKDPVASAQLTLRIATEELQEIMLYAQEAHCGTFLQIKQVLREFRSALDDLQKAQQTES